MRVFLGMLFGALIVGAALVGYFYWQENGETTPSPVSLNALTEIDDAAYFTALKADYQGQEGTAINVDALIDLMPAPLKVTYDSAGQDTDNGAYVVRGIKILSSETGAFGVEIDTLELWNFNEEAFSARISGQRLSETIKISDRVEASGMRVVGLETLYQPIADLSAKATSDFFADAFEASELTAEMVAAVSTDIEKYEFSVDSAILTDLTLHPYEMVPFAFPEETSAEQIEFSLEANDLEAPDAGDEADAEQVLHMLQVMAAINRAVSFDAFAMYDTKAAAIMTDGSGTKMDMSFTLPITGYKGFDRGNIELASARGMSFSMDMGIPVGGDSDPFTGEQSPTRTVPFNMSGGAEVYRFRDMRLGTLLDHLAKGIAPEKSVTDLLSLGVWEVENEAYKFGDIPFYSLKKAIFDLRDFHWFIPNRARIEIDDMVYNIGGLIDWAAQIAAAEGQGMSEEEQQLMAQIVSVLEENDFAAPVMDWDLSWDWNTDDGNFEADHVFHIDDFLTFTADNDLVLPDYKTLMADFSYEGMDEEDMQAMAAAFSEAFAIKGATLELADKGGLEKGFAMAVAFADIAPEDDPSMAFLRGANPEDLRIVAASSMRLMAGQAAQAFPPAKAYIVAFADFVAKGGTLKLALRPEEPVTLEMLEAISTADNPPEAAVDLLGLTFERSSK